MTNTTETAATEVINEPVITKEYLEKYTQKFVSINLIANVSNLVYYSLMADDVVWTDYEDSCDELQAVEYEVFHHYFVTEYMADALKEVGQTVVEWQDGHYVWARGNAGQAVYMDGPVIEAAKVAIKGYWEITNNLPSIDA